MDGTFYENDELPNRDMSQIPHPFVTETMTVLEKISAKEKAKVQFIHLNHTNRLLWDQTAKNAVRAQGFGLAEEGQIVTL